MGEDKLKFGTKVSFVEKAKTEKSNIEVNVTIEGFIRGIKIEPSSTGTYKKYLVADKSPQAYCTPSDYGWFTEKQLTQTNEE